VAIVDAFDDPNAERDLATYRSQFGLPACSTANGCFSKVDQDGGLTYPSANSGWAQEISLDLDVVSAVCPNCHIVLVEAKSNSFTNLGTAINRAIAMGAKVVSNSYGGSEWSGEASFESTYLNHPGIPITASTGDSGFDDYMSGGSGPEFPAASRYVTAVGGTSLNPASSPRGWSESAWNGAGSGCSAVIPKPAWQKDGGCSTRAVGDVSAVADPFTGVAVYDSVPSQGSSGWLIFGGTSVAAPLVGAMYALGGSSVSTASSVYADVAGLYDVASGSNGSCGSYLCNAGAGYDGPTGLGTPNGTAAFGGAAVAPTPDFGVAVSPSTSSINIGGTASYTVTLTAQNAYASSVGLSVSGLPSAASASFNSTSVTPTSSGAASTLTISTTSAISAGTYKFTITATGSDTAKTQHAASATLVVNGAADYSISVTPSSRNVTAGSSASYTINLSPANGYASSVGLQVSGLPANASASFSSSSVDLSSGAGSATLTVSTAANTPAGTSQLTISGTGSDSAAIKHSTTASVVVAAAATGDFSIAAAPSSATIFPGMSSSYTVTLKTANGYSTPVGLTVSGLSAGVTASFSQTTVTPSSGGTTTTLTVSASSSTGFKQATLTITGTATDGSGLKHTTTVSALIL
jgi:hypothetical protein